MTKNSNLINEIKALILTGEVGTQEEICIALQSKHFEVNQSKISRLLRKMGAVKVTNERGQIVYQMPKEPGPPAPDSRFSSYIIRIESNEVGVVIRTVPGSAQLAARLIDFNADKCLSLGTVAGDDTVFVIPRSITEVQKSVAQLRKLFGL